MSQAAPYKILPEMFHLWTRLVAGIEGSILWLRPMRPEAEANLRKEANERGIPGDRLIFAPHEPLPQYLARYALADLYLDTFPFGSHTTVNDALFAGLPVLTLAGRSMAARASASQVRAAGLPELIATSHREYESIALALARERERLRALTSRLRSQGRASALFDMDSYARRFEDALLGDCAAARRDARANPSLSRLHGRGADAAAADAPRAARLPFQRVQRKAHGIVGIDQSQGLDHEPLDHRAIEEFGIARGKKRRVTELHHGHEGIRVAELRAQCWRRIAESLVLVAGDERGTLRGDDLLDRFPVGRAQPGLRCERAPPCRGGERTIPARARSPRPRAGVSDVAAAKALIAHSRARRPRSRDP